MTDWTQAECLNADPDMFVPEDGQGAWPAKAICRGCPIMRECREFGLSVPVGNYMGVYGGLSERERRKIRSGKLTEAAIDAHDAEVASAGGQRALAGLRGGATKRRQAQQRREAECGTPSGYQRHRRLGEDMCAACEEAKRTYMREYMREYMRRRREAA